MIVFDPLWETLKEKNLTTYRLITDYNLSRGTLDSLKHNRSVTLNTIDQLCEMIDCNVEDIIKYIKEE